MSNNAKRNYRLLMITHGSWFSLFQRPHHFARILKEKFYIVVCGHEQLLLSKKSIDSSEQLKIVDQVIPIKYLLRGQYRLKIIKLFNSLFSWIQLKKQLTTLLSDTNTKFVYTWRVEDIRYLSLLKPHHFVVYDAMDDWSHLNNNGNQKIVENEKKLIKRANLVLTTSEKIFSRISEFHSDVKLVRNGVDCANFTKAITYEKNKDDELFKFKNKTIVGYVGFLADWIDIELIRNCALKFNNMEFIVIGTGSKEYLSMLEGIPNLHYLGPKSYLALFKYVAYFDIGLIPFKMNTLNESTNPIKLYEYLAAGLPVVSTALKEVCLYKEDGVVHTAKTQEEFFDGIEKFCGLKNNEAFLKKRLQIAEQNSWRSRVSILIEKLEQVHST